MTLMRDRLPKARELPPVAAPVVEPDPAALVAELPAETEQAAPLGQPEPIVGDLDPLTLDILADIPDRPKRPEPVASNEGLDELTEQAVSARAGQLEKVKRAGPLVAAGGLVLGLIGWMAYGSRRPVTSAPVAVEGPAVPGPAPVATPQPVVTMGGRNHV